MVEWTSSGSGAFRQGTGDIVTFSAEGRNTNQSTTTGNLLMIPAIPWSQIKGILIQGQVFSEAAIGGNSQTAAAGLDMVVGDFRERISRAQAEEHHSTNIPVASHSSRFNFEAIRRPDGTFSFFRGFASDGVLVGVLPPYPYVEFRAEAWANQTGGFASVQGNIGLDITFSDGGPGLPGPEPGGQQLHEIRVKYREGVFGIADRLAQKSTGLVARIADLLPDNFHVEEVYADTAENEIVVRIYERGRQVIPIAVVILIVAVVVALISLFFLGYTYKENAILKATGRVQQAGLDEITGIVENPNLTDDEKIRLIKIILDGLPAAVIPDGDGDGGGGPLDDVGDIVKWGAIGLIGFAAIQALGSMRRGR